MKTIYIARHAKSSWGSSQVSDIDRPLKPSGIIDVQKVSERLKDSEPRIESIYTSPAVRAVHTAVILSRCLEFPEDRIDIRSSIYYHGKEGIKDLIQSLDNSLSSIMICGHNPTLTNFTNDYLKIPLEKIQTSSVMKIQLSTDDWSQIQFADVHHMIYFNRQETKELE